jgi:hypothetical protein
MNEDFQLNLTVTLEHINSELEPGGFSSEEYLEVGLSPSFAFAFVVSRFLFLLTIAFASLPLGSSNASPD